MANYNNDIGSYSHSYFTGSKQYFTRDGVAGSNTDFAHFAARNKVLVRSVSIELKSNTSITTGTLKIMRTQGGSAGEVTKWTAAGLEISAGYATTVTLTEKNTLDTITSFMSVRLDTNAKGEWHVIYNYQVLFPADYA